jgi:hypothetical protein
VIARRLPDEIPFGIDQNQLFRTVASDSGSHAVTE